MKKDAEVKGDKPKKATKVKMSEVSGGKTNDKTNDKTNKSAKVRISEVSSDKINDGAGINEVGSDKTNEVSCVKMDYEINSMFGINGQIAIITGAAGGIGREIALAMGSLGAKLVLVDMNIKLLEETNDEFNKMGLIAIALKTDITDKDSVNEMIETAVKHYGRIDILVNCAGLAYVEAAVDFDLTKWEQVMDVNVKGTMLTCQAAGRYMLQQKRGRIVNFSSVRGLQGKERYLAYAPSKGAVNLLTKTLAVEWAKENVNVNAVAPVFTLTDMNRSILADPKTYEWVISRIPKGRLCETNLLVGPVIFLCSPCADFITGHILYVDGGWTAG